MTQDTGTLNLRSASILVEGLHRNGMRNVVVSPGSRSTPLAVAFHRHPGIRVWMHVDERSAGFFALGMARATRMAVGLVCSSGTAAANYLPAVVEAFLGRTPLIVMTADRPIEVRGWGAAQTIDQVAIYGSHAKLFAELPVPEDREELLRQVAATAARAMAIAGAAPAGPVHLNVPFREPLVPADGHVPVAPGMAMPIAAAHSDAAPSAEAIAGLAREIVGAPRGVIVCGPDVDLDPRLPDAVAALAAATGYPVLADGLSGVRCGPHDRGLVVDAYDAVLRDPETAGRLRPDVVLRFGAIPTSKPLLQFLERSAPSCVALFDRLPGWRDPHFLATVQVDGTPALSALALAEEVGRGVAGRGWATEWLEAGHAARAAMDETADPVDGLFEGRVFRELADLLPDGATLVAGNSMPVRDLDTFFPPGARRIRFHANRGANGIDGVVSTALGFAAGGDGPVVLVIGDLSFYHDLNGLLAAKLHALDATIVVVNNDGGGIFSFLPQASATDAATFETLFGTPIDLDIGRAAALYGGSHVRVDDWQGFREAVSAGIAGRGLHVVEVPSRRDENVTGHRAVWQAVAERLSSTAVANP